MIARIWHGWTSRENAPAYQSLLLNEILPGIAGRNLTGYRGVSLMRRDQDRGVEFMTIIWFDSMAAVGAFAGDDYETAVVPPKARALLSSFDERSAHYQTIVPPPQSVAPRHPGPASA